MKDSIAILWDIENVTPSSNSLFVGGLIDYALELGRISVAMAYGDWTKKELKGISGVLAVNSFEMMHVPQSRKDSADITLITNAIEIVYQYPHIKKIILVTGDADFRPLLQSLRKHGLETTIICDAKSASEDLLMLADNYKDYRELIPVTAEEPDADDEEDDFEEPSDKRGARTERRGGRLSFDESVALLKEAVAIMLRSKKNTSIGAVKIRMKLLNGNFNERELRTLDKRAGTEKNGKPPKELKFRTWKDFVLAAAKADPTIELVYGDNDTRIMLKATGPEVSGHNSAQVNPRSGASVGAPSEDSPVILIPEVIRQLLLAVKNCTSAKSTDNWVPYSMVSQYLIDIGIDIREFNYGRIRTLIEAAEKRNLVEIRNENQHWLVRLSPEGASYT